MLVPTPLSIPRAGLKDADAISIFSRTFAPFSPSQATIPDDLGKTARGWGGGVTGDEPVFIFQGEKVNGQWPRMTARVRRGGILRLAGSTDGSESGAQSVLSHRYLGGREFLAPASLKRT